MKAARDWQQFRETWQRLLEEATGQGVKAWNARVEREDFGDEPALRQWLGEQGVTGYAQTLLVMERFGYPDFLTASADELIEGQYADRPQLRPICEAILRAVSAWDDVTIQARKTYISLLTPRRTFARVVPSTRTRVDLGLRLDGQAPGGRLLPSKINATMQVQISFSSLDEVDTEALDWLKQAYEQNR